MPYAPLRRTMMPLGRVFGAPGWWLSGGISASACVAAYAAKGASSQAASYTNLANPGTYDLTLGVAPTWATGTGWTFNGSSQYLKTGITSQATWSVIIRFSSRTNNGYLVGTTFGSNGMAISPNRIGSAVRYWHSRETDVAPSLDSGVLAITGAIGYRNGVSDGALYGTISGTSAEWYIGGSGYSGLYGPIAASIQALAIYNATLSAAQVAAVTTAMNAL